MRKAEIAATELTDTKVQFVSMVKRGANRIPFRLTKGDTEMLDFSRLFRKAEAAPAVLAAVVRKGGDLDRVKDRLTKAGLSVDVMEEKDGHILFIQKEAGGVDEAVLKLDDDVALVVSGLAKMTAEYDCGHASLDEVFAADAFRPSIRLALDMFNGTVRDMLSKAESGEEVASDLARAVDEFKGYLVGLARRLPAQAFKADVGECGASEPQAGPVGEAEVKEKEPVAGDRSDAASPAADAADSPEAAAKDKAGGDGETSPAPAEDTAAAVKTDEAADEPDVADVVKSLLGEALAPLLAEIKAFKSDMMLVDRRLDEVDVRSRKAEEAVHGSIVNSVTKDDGGRLAGSEGGAPPLLDTAYSRRH